MFRTLAITAALLVSALSQAGQYNEVLSIGDSAPAWVDLPGTDGKKHSLADLADKPVVVVVFTCASCPTAVDYEDRIQALAKKYGGANGKAAVVAICVNRVPADELPALTERANQKNFAFAYLYDESQKIAKDYGAMGAMDDATDATKVTKRHVEDAIAAALEGKSPEVTEVIARGCRVRYARERPARPAR
jgi:peroxiredoxin